MESSGFFVLLYPVMGEFAVYVLYSEKYNRTYTGYTTNLIERFKSHNYLGKKGFTKKYRPWCVILVEFYPDKIEARKRELFLKSGVGRTMIRKIFIAIYFQTKL